VALEHGSATGTAGQLRLQLVVLVLVERPMSVAHSFVPVQTMQTNGTLSAMLLTSGFMWSHT
jgi:hypothetical protein